MNKEKILNWVKANKKSVGIIGGVLVGVLLIGGGYGIYKYTSNPSEVVKNKENITLQKQEATAENTSDNSNENKDGQKDNETNGQVDNQENTSNNKTDSNTIENKQENKDEKSNNSNGVTSAGNGSQSKGNSQSSSSTIGNGSNNQNSKQSNNSSSSSNNSQSKPNTSTSSKPNGSGNTSHSHSWTPITKVVHHKEQGHYENVVVKPAWTEKVPVYEEKERAICNGCGKDITSNITEHNRNHALNGEKGGWHTEWKKVQVGTKIVKHEAIYNKKWVVDKKAYDETVTTGYKCSCGASK
ncbi:hypothetical protein K5V21_12750 [Clostridium sardiniense]|uniref:C2H2-type domain-containing protein n=1 Tax=Clostridium sardiniense TaxID=29369 RepID=A0ABS7L0Q0_CLOSR|nr:hypothetical protein [Clostridium sardiniense]MBY0756317.1 hypothetical protein [Clostridium sardiniense]MDQ0461474.1 hypothetical protein [Clostridium sardiniense]